MFAVPYRIKTHRRILRYGRLRLGGFIRGDFGGHLHHQGLLDHDHLGAGGGAEPQADNPSFTLLKLMSKH